LGIAFSFVAGIMLFVFVDKLFPAARKYGKGHQQIYAFVKSYKKRLVIYLTNIKTNKREKDIMCIVCL